MKCEKWNRDDDSGSEESKATWWLKRLIGRTKKVTVDWPFPFAESKLFVLTLIAGLEGYHINVDGRHISSFPYRPVSICTVTLVMVILRHMLTSESSCSIRDSLSRMPQDSF